MKQYPQDAAATSDDGRYPVQNGKAKRWWQVGVAVAGAVGYVVFPMPAVGRSVSASPSPAPSPSGPQRDPKSTLKLPNCTVTHLGSFDPSAVPGMDITEFSTADSGNVRLRSRFVGIPEGTRGSVVFRNKHGERLEYTAIYDQPDGVYADYQVKGIPRQDFPLVGEVVAEDDHDTVSAGSVSFGLLTEAASATFAVTPDGERVPVPENISPLLTNDGDVDMTVDKCTLTDRGMVIAGHLTGKASATRQRHIITTPKPNKLETLPVAPDGDGSWSVTTETCDTFIQGAVSNPVDGAAVNLSVSRNCEPPSGTFREISIG